MRLRRTPRAPLPFEQDFAGAVRVGCDRMGLLVVSLGADVVEVRGRRLQGTIALEDLRARCALLPRGQWEDEVTDALQGLALGREARVALDDLAAVRPLLRTRVVAEGAVLVEDVVRRPLCAGFVETLVVLLDGAVAPVPGGTARAWGEDLQALLDLGVQQALAGEAPQVAPLDLGAVHLTRAETEGPFCATHLHRLDRLLPVPPAGALLALPTRHLLLAAPLQHRDSTLLAAQALLVNAEALWRTGPGGLAPDLLWWRAGRAPLPLPGSPTSLSPPREFLDVLDALPAGPAG